jgi:hypothetical protein
MKKIDFIASSKEVEDFVESPSPAKLLVPEWYKKAKPFKEKDVEIDESGMIKNTSLKMCMPFFDALTGGYVQKTWTDIFVKRDSDGNFFEIYYSFSPSIVRIRDSTNISINKSVFYDKEFIWIEPWVPKLPKGYSILYTHPLNRLDLPFTSLSAIVDSDNYYHTSFGQYPFYIRKDFEGLIPAGTPMYQMIPFKRESWIKSCLKFDSKINEKNTRTMMNNFWGIYKQKFWEKKNFN